MHSHPAVFLLLTLIGCVLPYPSASAASEERIATRDFEPLDVFALEWASDPQVAPDGGTIAYTRNGYNIMTDRQTSRIWLINTDGENHRPLSDRAGSSARFSPDGSRIAFISPTSEGAEVYMHWLADNRTARITQLPENPGNLTWSPDSTRLAFTMFTAKSPEPMIKPLKAPEGAKWGPKFNVYESVQYRADGQGYLRQGFTHVYVIAADGGAARQVTSGDYHHAGGISWAVDGLSLYVSANRNPDWELEVQDSNIFQVDLVSGAIKQITDRYGPDSQPRVSPNGRYLAYLGYDDKYRGYENAQLYFRDLLTEETQSLTATLDRSVSNPVWRDDSRAIYVQFDDQGIGKVSAVSLGGLRSMVVNDLGGTAISRPYSGGSFGVAADTVAYTRSLEARPANLAVAQRGRIFNLTRLNANLLDHTRLADIEEIRFPSSLDGREIQGWVAKPPGFSEDKAYPTILEIHGGPFAAYGPNFSAEVQLYAAAGYLVLYVNPRGSTSYGEAFANLIHHDYPGGDFDDLMSAVDYTIDKGWSDPQRLFVTGGSGGGILTTWIITHTERFAAAVAAKPVINWYSFVLTADGYPFFSRYWFEKKPWEDPNAYLARSPLQFVDKVTTPTMLMTGEDDHRTPISEAEQFYQALKLLGIEAALVRIPGASHGIASRPSHLISKVQHVLAWFERYPTLAADKPANDSVSEAVEGDKSPEQGTE
jgi:dipeptidyl aminopeptidase/acylaminoacyl peptidase